MKWTTNPTPLQALVTRSLSFAAIAAFTLNPALTPVFAGDYRVPAARSSGVCWQPCSITTTGSAPFAPDGI